MAAHALPGHAGQVDALGRSQVPVEVELLHLEGFAVALAEDDRTSMAPGDPASVCPQATIVNSRLASFSRWAPWAVTATWSSIRTPKRPSR